jgi:excinuclease ABC subunit B
MFNLETRLKPIPPQKEASEKISKNIKDGAKDNILLGVTGCGKTFIMANVIQKIQKPTLIISHNKTLAAQLYQEFKDFFPKNSVHYFVSYYDYYQPEAYIPQTDTYIEKDAKVNQVIDRLRHEATQSLMERKDVIVVASVSCIYNIGSPENYQKISLRIKTEQNITRRELMKNLVRLQYQRNDINFTPGSFRLRGESLEIFLPTGREIITVNIPLGTVSSISRKFIKEKNESSEFQSRGRYNPNFATKTEEIKETNFYPAKFWVTPQDKISLSVRNIRTELQDTILDLKTKNKFSEAERLERRTNYDLEMIAETGWCYGIENYSRHLEFRTPGSAPSTLLDYYTDDYLIIIDESHMTIPQIFSMSKGDEARKRTLIDYGFRLPSALDNRPLTFEEFEKKVPQTTYVSATPGKYEFGKIKNKKRELLTEVLIRPTGLLDPRIEIKSTKNQIEDLVQEIENAIKNKERVLVTTLTKRLAEDLSDYLKDKNFKVNYLHSEVKTLERPAILRDLRKGKYDIIVGINLLREGLDMPEVALIAILDADKEGFLRNETTLIQTMGRAARHPKGRIIMYADQVTQSMKRAIKETERRREIQKKYNKEHNITPSAIEKEIKEWLFSKEAEEEAKSLQDLARIKDVKELKKEMEKASKSLDFEKAARIRDEIKRLQGK